MNKSVSGSLATVSSRNLQASGLACLMSEINAMSEIAPEATQDLDVLINGAGISAIGATDHLGAKCPGKSFAILESKARLVAPGTGIVPAEGWPGSYSAARTGRCLSRLSSR